MSTFHGKLTPLVFGRFWMKSNYLHDFLASVHVDGPRTFPFEKKIFPYLVGGFNPFEKYLSNWESSPSRAENKRYLKQSPSYPFAAF